jgi:serine/threonine protein kinase
VLENTADCAQTQIGTPFYLSPEICMNQPYSYASDVWALGPATISLKKPLMFFVSIGCILYEMAMLTTPFTGRTLPELVRPRAFCKISSILFLLLAAVLNWLLCWPIVSFKYSLAGSEDHVWRLHARW